MYVFWREPAPSCRGLSPLLLYLMTNVCLLKRASPFVQRFVPFAAVAAANAVNIPLMRQRLVQLDSLAEFSNWPTLLFTRALCQALAAVVLSSGEAAWICHKGRQPEFPTRGGSLNFPQGEAAWISHKGRQPEFPTRENEVLTENMWKNHCLFVCFLSVCSMKREFALKIWACFVLSNENKQSFKPFFILWS